MLFRPRFRLAYSCCLAIAAFAMGAALGVAKPAAATSHEFQALGLQPPKEVVEAPDFTLKDLNGKKVQLRDFRGKVVFLKFEIRDPKSEMENA